MKLTLLKKFLITYFILISISIIVFQTIGISVIRNHALKEKRDLLYNVAQQISSQYQENHTKSNQSLDSILKNDYTLNGFLDTRIWIVASDGTLVIDTQNMNTETINIHDLDDSFLEKSYSENTQLGDLLTEPMLSVILPITIHFEMKGYIIVHTPMNSVAETIDYYTHFFTIVLFLLLMGFLLLLGIIYYITIIPLKSTIEAATEYSKGNFSYSLSIKNKDEFRELSTSIQFMAQELQSLDDYQKNFVANISHDFRSPLTSIKGYAEAMIDGTIDPSLYQKYLDIILFEAERLTKLTTNLLTLNSFDNKGNLLDMASFELNKIIKQIASSFEGICRKKNIKLKLSFFHHETFVNGDMGKIQQVLYNLLDNAIKFSHQNSNIHITVTEKNDKVFISVKDYGIGIPKESVQKVWDRFYKSDMSRGKDKKGTGLGLSIAKEIIKAHGEHINVISTPGVGTEFIFSLPKVSQSAFYSLTK